MIFWRVALAEPSVSLLTALPGGEIYELEGHTALRVHDPERGVDVAVNWGLYDFNQPNFVYRFVKGETDYMCGAQPMDRFLASYMAQGRKVVEQHLALDSMQTAMLIELAGINLLPQNATYRYNYVKDNCATRPLLLIEQAAGRELVPDTGNPTTWRREMRRYHHDYPWYQFGIDLALGRGIDSTIHERGRIFAPVELMEAVERSGIVSYTQSYGEQTLEHHPTPWWQTPQALAWLVLVIAAALSVRDWRRRRLSKWFDSVMFTLFGLTGCVLVFLVFVSEHEATSPNLLLLWLNPFCLLGALLPWIKSAKKVAVCYFFVNFALLLVLAALAPILGRGMNAAFWPLMVADALRSIVNAKLLCQRKANRT